MDGYKQLAAAIVERALLDYKVATKNIHINRDMDNAEGTILEISRFLKSDWFMMLSELDGKLLLKLMKEEMA